MKLLVPVVERLLSGGADGLKLALLNRVLARLVPFNAPHGIVITKLGAQGVRARLPYRRRNLNHVGGLHACALATTAEFASGIYLLSRVPFSGYRLLMQTMTVRYARQGRGAAVAVCEPDPSWFETMVSTPLAAAGECSVRMEVPVLSDSGEELCRADVEWQLKSWEAIRAKRGASVSG